MKYKIVIKDNFTLEELRNEIKNGGRFIVFPYCISLVFAVTLRRFSPAIFVKNGESIVKLKNKYNLISYIFGWWGIPYGPIHTIADIKMNNNGGIDITEDILLNITEQDLQSKEIDLKITNLLFDKPSKSEIKAFKKAIFNKFEENYKIEKVVVGQFINEDNNGNHYIIGLSIEGEFETYSDPLKNALFTQFFKHVQFDFVDLTIDSIENKLLLQQGEILK